MNHRQAVSRHNSRARSLDLPATLTCDEWERTVAFFSGLCAYCAASPVEHLDHFVPLVFGGGTTAGNCLPACERCNLSKSGKHPDAVSGDIVSRLPYLRNRLKKWSTGVNVVDRTCPMPLVIKGLTAEDFDTIERERVRRLALCPWGTTLTRNNLIIVLIREALAAKRDARSAITTSG